MIPTSEVLKPASFHDLVPFYGNFQLHHIISHHSLSPSISLTHTCSVVAVQCSTVQCNIAPLSPPPQAPRSRTMPPKKRARGGAVAVPISSDDTRQQRRRSLRASVGSAPTPATGKRSAYFEGDESDENEEEQPPPRKKQSQGQGRGRGEVKSTPRGRKKGVIIEDSDEYDDEGVDEEEEGESAGEDSTPPVPPPSLPQKRGRGRPPQSAASKQQSPNKTNTKRQSIKATTNGSAKSKAKAEVPEVGDGEEYEDEDGGEDDDEDDDEDEEEEGRVTFIPMPKLRDTGGVEYTDTRLHPNTLLFLGDLKANNNRKWLKSKSTMDKFENAKLIPF